MRELLGAGYEQWWTGYRAQLQTLAAARRNPPGSPPVGPHFIIPVVVHIIHDGGASNISDAQVYDAIRVANEVYAETDPDTAQIIPYFKPRIGNTNIEFRLAKLDPNGNCTNGITRHVSALTHAATDAVKNLPGARWDTRRYLNVWVAQTMASGSGGYAYFPCTSTQIDGIVLRSAQFGSIGPSANCQLCAKTLPHEIGHYLGLPHTWGGTNTPGLPANCQDDDGIADTPNTVGTQGGCNTAFPACLGDPSPIANVQNIMDYSNCPAMFTQGQAGVMNDGVNLGGFACRQLLVSVANQTVTGVATGQVIPPCLPIAFLTTVGAMPTELVQRVCAGGTIQFRGEAYNVAPNIPVQFRWSFPGGVPATATGTNPTVTYPTAGQYSVTLTATTAAGSDSTTQAGYVKVQNANSGLTTPDVESFESPQFPLNPADPFKNWEVSPTTGTTWEYTSAAATHGTGSGRLRLRNTAVGTDYDLISANIMLTRAISRPYLTFKRAYARLNASSDDRLTMSTSFDCGRTWITRGGTAIRSATQLATGSPTGGTFVPTAAQWRADSMLISSGTIAAGSHLMVRFRVLSDRGSALYLDDFRIGGRVTGLAADASVGVTLTVLPNPSDGDAQVRVSTGAAGGATLRLYDAAGRLLGRPYAVASTGAGQERDVALRAVAGSLAAGVYVVELTTADGTRRTQRALVY